jgi:hypothetical protein
MNQPQEKKHEIASSSHLNKNIRDTLDWIEYKNEFELEYFDPLKVLSEEKSSLLIKFIKSTLEDAKQKEI